MHRQKLKEILELVTVTHFRHSFDSPEIAERFIDIVN